MYTSTDNNHNEKFYILPLVKFSFHANPSERSMQPRANKMLEMHSLKPEKNE